MSPAPLTPPPDGAVLLRARSAPWLVGAVSLVCLVLVVDALARGYIAETLRTATWLVLFCWVAFLVLVRPRIVVTDEGIEVRNILHACFIPWSAVSHVTLRFQTTIVLRDDRLIRCWGGPTVGLDRVLRAGPRATGETRGRGNRSGRGVAADARQPDDVTAVRAIFDNRQDAWARQHGATALLADPVRGAVGPDVVVWQWDRTAVTVTIVVLVIVVVGTVL